MTTAIQVATDLLDRVRDVGGLSLSATFPPSSAAGVAYAKVIISAAQRLVNNAEQNQLVTIPFTTTPYQTLYNIDSDPVLGTGGTSPIIKIVEIQDAGGRTIGECPFQQIYTTDFKWFRSQGPRYLAWARVGHDCWVLYPANSGVTVVQVVATPYIPDLVADTDTLTVTDDLMPQVMDLAEAIALFKLGQYKLATAPLGRLQESYKAELAGDAWRKATS